MKVYFPIKYIDIEASPPHPENTKYRVSVGHEHWDDEVQRVYKVQMMYDGRVTGRRSPSYPEGSNDLENVFKTLQKLKKGGGNTGRGMINPVGGENFEPPIDD